MKLGSIEALEKVLKLCKQGEVTALKEIDSKVRFVLTNELVKGHRKDSDHIRRACKDYILYCREHRLGPFAADVIFTEDALNWIKTYDNGPFSFSGMTVLTLGAIFRELGFDRLPWQYRKGSGEGSVRCRVWVLRNAERWYAATSREVREEIERVAQPID